MTHSHGHTRHYTVTPTYASWSTMRSRAGRIKNYLDRQVCERWNTFELFLEDMGERPSRRYSLERIDNNRGYEPGNCQWATRGEQSRNTSRNVYVTIGDRTQLLMDWLTELGLPDSTYYNRRYRGLTPEQALKGPFA
jgi:hypothetical protein